MGDPLSLEYALQREIKETLSDRSKKSSRTSFFSSSEDILEYVFSSSGISLYDYSRGPFDLQSFKAFAEDPRIFEFIKKDRKILFTLRKIKDLYFEKIINPDLSAKEFIEKHMNELARVLDPTYISSAEEFYKRAELLRENLAVNNKTEIAPEILYPEHYHQKKIKEAFLKYRNSL